MNFDAKKKDARLRQEEEFKRQENEFEKFGGFEDLPSAKSRDLISQLDSVSDSFDAIQNSEILGTP